ncbi:gamma-aminobutyric acid type B receptor subunit 1-like [Asterias rubens]|uniref:gamma-aminobutyric acid type B receptor subunit 1-like n=1 Tax=Asterias rubens TaxID=7604 RepID=UPI001454F061|nr:gamma-aminobutyric acid type B receptor subunit 1-like [Asterias rubens]
MNSVGSGHTSSTVLLSMANPQYKDTFNFIWTFWMMTIMTAGPCDSSNRTKLHILGLYPMTGSWPGGLAMSLATQLALEDINANADILSGYELVVIPKDTECNGGKATDVMYRELFNRSTVKMMILGGGCSVATEPTAQASHHWNLIQISIAASPSLSNRFLFPRSFRLLPPETMFNVAKFALFMEFNWTKVATLHQFYPLFSQSMTDFHKEAKNLGVEIIAAESFVEHPAFPVENIKRVGARIIVVGAYADMTRRVFCEAYHQNMYGAKYVWIMTGWLEYNWWREPDDAINCTVDQMEEAIANQFGVYIDTTPSHAHWKPTRAGLTTNNFLERFETLLGTNNSLSLPGYVDISLVYDTAWTQALALHQAQERLAQLDPPRTLEDFEYDNITVNILFDIISNMTFQGVSGPVQFDPNGDRLGLLEILQMQAGNFVSVGIVDPTVDSGRDIEFNENYPIVWQGRAPPIDFIITRETRQTIRLPVVITGSIFAALGIVLACCFLTFNVRYRKKRVIKMSSPNINNLMLIGGMLAYTSVIFLGVDTGIASAETFILMCKAKTWCLSIGFSLAFGSMFSKTWRVHKIFTNKTAMKTVLMRDQWLFGYVAALVLIDVVILVLWEIIDPVLVKEHYGRTVTHQKNDDIVYISTHTICESANHIYWIGSFYVINGLLLVFGAFLAWETRKVSIPALNDSKNIGICVYNVLILSFVGATVSFVLVESNTHYSLIATLIWVATTLTLCVVFVPKMQL